MKLPEQFLCVITGGGTDPVTLAGMALDGGASMIQLRDKSATGEQLFRWAVAIQKLCRRHQALFIVNDRVDIALAMNADGVHLGQTDLPPEAARALLGADKIIGVSVADASEALDALHKGASYIGLGHIFPTGSKLKISLPLGLETISAVAAACPLPIVAIGGISEKNAAEAIAAGASGVAVIAAVCSAENPEEAARTLVASIRRNAS